jgi:hypothetical protein
MTEGTHIRFVEVEPNIKTKRWRVEARRSNDFLGFISYFGRWNQYSFFPHENCVFEKTCLREIASFCQEQTTEQKRGLHRR